MLFIDPDICNEKYTVSQLRMIEYYLILTAKHRDNALGSVIHLERQTDG